MPEFGFRNGTRRLGVEHRGMGGAETLLGAQLPHAEGDDGRGASGARLGPICEATVNHVAGRRAAGAVARWSGDAVSATLPGRQRER